MGFRKEAKQSKPEADGVRERGKGRELERTDSERTDKPAKVLTNCEWSSMLIEG